MKKQSRRLSRIVAYLLFIALLMCAIIPISGCSESAVATEHMLDVPINYASLEGDISDSETDDTDTPPTYSESPSNDSFVDSSDSTDDLDKSNSPDNDNTIENVYKDDTAPTLTIVTPAEATSNAPVLAMTTTYTVTGKVSDNESGIKSLTVNGASAAVRSDGSWSVNVVLRENEPQEVTVIATDNAGNTTTATRHVEYKQKNTDKDSTAYALVLDNKHNSDANSRPMIFVKSTTVVSAGDIYDSKTFGKCKVMAVYKGFDTASYSSANAVPWNGYGITSVVAEDKISPNSMAYWFYEMKICTQWDLKNIDTSRVIDMSYMFYQAGYYAETLVIDLSAWNTSSVNNIEAMFYQTGYKADEFVLDLTGWNTSSVTNMANLFRSTGYYADACAIDGISGWDTSAVEDMSYTFHRTGFDADIFKINLSKWNTSSVETMDNMFSYSGYRAKVWSIGDISNWDTSKVKDMSEMFESAGREAERFEINVANFDTSSVESMRNMFRYSGYNANVWSIGDLSGWDTSSVKDMNAMFASAGLNAKYSLVLSDWNVSHVTDYSDFNSNATDKITPPDFE